MRIGLVTSAVGHAAVLLWSIVSFAAKPYDVAVTDSVPVDIISATEFSQLTKGVKNAEKVTTPKPFVEKVADPSPPKEEATPKVVEKKQEIANAAEPPPPPKQAEPPPVKKPPPPKPTPKFDPIKTAALLDKRDPRRQSITGQELHNEQSLGSPMGNAATLSQNEMDMLRNQMAQCWRPPTGLADAKSLIVAIRVNFNQNGT